MLETGGGRRTWLRGDEKVRKRYSIATAAYNLGVLMRTLFGIGTARSLQAFRLGLEGVWGFNYLAWTTVLICIDLQRPISRDYKNFRPLPAPSAVMVA